jgi:hypothetical protein
MCACVLVHVVFPAEHCAEAVILLALAENNVMRMFAYIPAS